MGKILFFNFDGTCNEPEDAVQDENVLTGIVDDSNISNILKFHLLLGGNPKNRETELDDGNLAFYYRGVGTYGNFIEKGINTIFGHEDHDIGDILKKAEKDFHKYYKRDIEKIIITGFSRGGALARKFASRINEEVPKGLMIEAIFDTVARVSGEKDDEAGYKPSIDVKFNNHVVASNVEKALHIVSLDEKRKAFKPTLMTAEKKVMEIWFSGGHSDIGGGYRQDGLSDTTLGFFLDWIEDLDLNIKLLIPEEVKYKELKYENNMKNLIKKDDVEINPNPLDEAHQSKLPRIYVRKRACKVILNNGEKSNEPPLIHHSVVERISKISSYRPLALGEINRYKVYYDEDRILEYSGLLDHAYSMAYLIVLNEEKNNKEVEVRSRQKYNHSGVYFKKGQKYKIEVLGEGTWSDASITNSDVRKGVGWDRKSVEKGIAEIGFWFQELDFGPKKDNRRVTKDGVKWFTLCGTIGEDDSKAFVIGNSCIYEVKYSGEFCAFANDLPGRYGNNRGKLKIKITFLNEKS